MGLQVCTICGEEKAAGQVWFLVAESHWDDRLKVLQWQEDLANRNGMHQVCCPHHVQELVMHWMASGELGFALTGTEPVNSLFRVRGSALPIVIDADTRGGRELGELAVDRESVGRALNENPDSLMIIVDELRDALEREVAGVARLESGPAMSSGLVRQM
jgi:hypothetical protein